MHVKVGKICGFMIYKFVCVLLACFIYLFVLEMMTGFAII